MDLLKSMAFPCDKCNYLYGTNNCNRIKLRPYLQFILLYEAIIIGNHVSRFFSFFFFYQMTVIYRV